MLNYLPQSLQFVPCGTPARLGASTCTDLAQGKKFKLQLHLDCGLTKPPWCCFQQDDLEAGTFILSMQYRLRNMFVLLAPNFLYHRYISCLSEVQLERNICFSAALALNSSQL